MILMLNKLNLRQKKKHKTSQRNLTLMKNSNLQKDQVSLHIKMYRVKSVSNKIK